jgi:drug/metabolite transporter (DMT)-like permease
MTEPAIVSDANTPTARGAWPALHLAVLLFGLAGLFGKWLSLAPLWIVFGRTAFAGGALAIALLVSRQSLPRDRRNFALFACTGVLLAAHWLAFFRSIQISTVAIGLLGYASFPLFTTLIDAARVRRLPSASAWKTVALVTAGLIALVPEWRWGNQAVQGLAWGLLAGASFGLLTVTNRRALAGCGAMQLACGQNIAAAILLLPFAASTVAPMSLATWALLAALGIGCTALAHTLFIASMRRISAHAASVMAALEPVYGALFAWVLLGETPDARIAIGGAFIVTGVILARRRAD